MRRLQQGFAAGEIGFNGRFAQWQFSMADVMPNIAFSQRGTFAESARR